jgi:hypothetical protein
VTRLMHSLFRCSSCLGRCELLCIVQEPAAACISALARQPCAAEAFREQEASNPVRASGPLTITQARWF